MSVLKYPSPPSVISTLLTRPYSVIVNAKLVPAPTPSKLGSSNVKTVPSWKIVDPGEFTVTLNTSPSKISTLTWGKVPNWVPVTGVPVSAAVNVPFTYPLPPFVIVPTIPSIVILPIAPLAALV